MICEDKIVKAHSILMKELSSYIIGIQLDLDECFLKVSLLKGLIIYVTYNSHDEYSYQIIFSFKNLDRERFDNYDKNWNVSTSPHHFHMRNSENVRESKMTSHPDHDIPILINHLKHISNILYFQIKKE